MAYVRYNKKTANKALEEHLKSIKDPDDKYVSYGKKQSEFFLNIVHNTLTSDIARAKANGYKTVRERMREKELQSALDEVRESMLV